jgi:GNAT superfamily N-acetyltransferase
MPNNLKFIFPSASREERNYIDNKIIKFNSQQVPFTQNDPFINIGYVAKENDLIVGGITSLMYCWKCLYIDVLWVDEKHRHAGIGSKLLKLVEDQATEEGCHLAHLDTFDFQAKDFYLNHGYVIFGELDNCPQNHKRFYLKKTL